MRESLHIPENNLSSAYLIEGEDEKRLMDGAMEFSRRMLGEGIEKDSEAWRNMEARLNSFTHPDLIVLKPDRPEDNPHTISVDNIRKNLNDTIGIRPYEAASKIYLIQQAEKMNFQAQNALLKTLEEPPSYAIIMLLAGNKDAFLPTILSRVIELRDREGSIEERFRSLYENEWAKACITLLGGKDSPDIRDIMNFSKKLSDEKVSLADILSFIEIIIRDALCLKGGGGSDLLIAGEAEEEIERLSRRLMPDEIGEISNRLSEAFIGADRNVNRDLVLETLLMAF